MPMVFRCTTCGARFLNSDPHYPPTLCVNKQSLGCKGKHFTSKYMTKEEVDKIIEPPKE